MKQLIFTLIILINLNTLNAADESTLLESIGFLSASHCLLTITALGTTWDSWMTDGYSDEKFEEFTLSYQATIVATKDQLNSLYRYGQLHYDDKQYIGELIEIYDALYEQSRTALKYSYTKKDLDFNEYTSARTTTIKKMNTLFELGWE